MNNIEKIEKSLFNVVETSVHRKTLSPKLGIVYPNIDNYKLLIREDNGRPISVVKKTYKVIQNREIVEPFLEYLEKTDIAWKIDDMNSYFSDDRLRLKVVYPELNIKDDSDKGIALGHGLYNSFDGSGSAKILQYILRLVCSNGLTRWGKDSKISMRHSGGFTVEKFKRLTEQIILDAPVIGARVQALINIEANSEMLSSAKEVGTKCMSDYIDEESTKTDNLTQWQLLNIMTYFISHKMNKRVMAGYQHKVAKLFGI